MTKVVDVTHDPVKAAIEISESKGCDGYGHALNGLMLDGKPFWFHNTVHCDQCEQSWSCFKYNFDPIVIYFEDVVDKSDKGVNAVKYIFYHPVPKISTWEGVESEVKTEVETKVETEVETKVETEVETGTKIITPKPINLMASAAYRNTSYNARGAIFGRPVRFGWCKSDWNIW